MRLFKNLVESSSTWKYPTQAFNAIVDFDSRILKPGISKEDIDTAEDVFSSDDFYSVMYAKITKKEFKKGETAIAEHGRYSLEYASEVLKGPFPAGEPAIAASPEFSYEYAKLIGKSFKLGERTIAENSYYSLAYAREVLKGPFPAGEPAILTDSSRTYLYFSTIIIEFEAPATADFEEQYISKSDYDSKEYIEACILPAGQKPKSTKLLPMYNNINLWDRITVKILGKYSDTFEFKDYIPPNLLKQARQSFAKSSIFSMKYAYLTGSRFEDAEPIIAKSGLDSVNYARHIIKDRFELGEGAIIAEAEMLINNGSKISSSLKNYIYDYVFDENKLPPVKFEKIIVSDTGLLQKYAELFAEKSTTKSNSREVERAIILLNNKSSHKYIMAVYRDVYPRRADLMKNDRGITDPVHRYIAAYISNLPIRGGITGDPEIEALYKQEIL